MRESIQGRFTPQQKTIGVNDKFGNTGIRKQQGTTRIIYDTLALDGTRVFEFFKNSQSRPFPYSNTGSDGNKLGVGNTLVIERSYLSIVDASGENVRSIVPVLDANINCSELSVQIANSTVIKQIPLVSFLPEFNKSALHTTYNNFEYDTQLVIPPLLEFVFQLRTGLYTVDPEAPLFLRLTVEGTGAIIAPRTTF
jgi:hypothetical protein